MSKSPKLQSTVQQSIHPSIRPSDLFGRIRFFIIRKEFGYAFCLIIPTIIILIAITLFPFLYNLYLSFSNFIIFDASSVIELLGFGNYVELITDPRIYNALKNTAILVFGATFFEIIFGLIAGLLLYNKFAGREIVRTLIVFPMVITPVVVGLIWKALLDSISGIIPWFFELMGISFPCVLANYNLAIWGIIIVDVWQWTPFLTLIVLAGLESLPPEPFEMAKIDGASRWQIFRFVTLPSILPVLSIGVVFRVIDVFNRVDKIFIMTKGGPGVATETLHYYALVVGLTAGGRLAYAASIAVGMIILIIITSALLFKSVNIEREL